MKCEKCSNKVSPTMENLLIPLCNECIRVEIGARSQISGGGEMKNNRLLIDAKILAERSLLTASLAQKSPATDLVVKKLNEASNLLAKLIVT